MARRDGSTDANQVEGMGAVEGGAQERRFPLKALRGNCMALYGVTSSTFSGATTAIPDGEYTVEEAGRMVREWLKREVR